MRERQATGNSNNLKFFFCFQERNAQKGFGDVTGNRRGSSEINRPYSMYKTAVQEDFVKC